MAHLFNIVFIVDFEQLIFGVICRLYSVWEPKNPILNEDVYFILLVGCVIGPIVETYLFQVIPNKVLIKFKVSSPYLMIVLPSIILALIITLACCITLQHSIWGLF